MRTSLLLVVGIVLLVVVPALYFMAQALSLAGGALR
jgi:hypothetical protein